MSDEQNQEQQKMPGEMIIAMIMAMAYRINSHESSKYDVHVQYGGDFDFFEIRLLKGRRIEDVEDIRYYKRFDIEYLSTDDEQYKEALGVLRDLEQIFEGMN